MGKKAPRARKPIAIPSSIARTQLGSLLQEMRQNHTRFLITKGGQPAAVLLDVGDFEDMVEQMDPEFRRSLSVAANEYRGGESVTLAGYLKERVKKAR